MLETRAPGIAKHALQDTDDFRCNVWLSRWIGKLERVEGNWMLSVGRIKVNYVFDAFFWDEAKVINSEISVRVNNTVALIVENIR